MTGGLVLDPGGKKGYSTEKLTRPDFSNWCPADYILPEHSCIHVINENMLGTKWPRKNKLKSASLEMCFFSEKGKKCKAIFRAVFISITFH
jgi:hypothetical protein